MSLSDELLFFFSALGAFNGFLLGSHFLFFAKPRNRVNRFLGAFLIAISTRIGKSVFFYFNHDLHGTYIQLGLTACLFIGPFLYFYFRTALKDVSWKNWIYHVMVLFVLAIYVNYNYPWDEHYKFWRSHIVKAIYFIWLVYLIFAGVLLKNILKKLFKRGEKLSFDEIWMNSIFIGTCLIWIAYRTCPYTSYITGALTFSFVIYLLGLFLFINRKKRARGNGSSYVDNKISDQEAQLLIDQLTALMQDQEMYKNPNLKLPKVAQKMGILPHRLSQLLNDNLGKNFPSYINEYRIRAAKEMIKTDNHYTLEAIGSACGFNSKSSFYAIFKKMTGTTPAKYKEKLV